jgi:Domain of unknown function (DUF1996)
MSDINSESPSQDVRRQKALGFNCLNYQPQHNEGALTRHFMPNKTFLDNNCPDGLRLELAFPSCWNGVDVVSDDHRNHVAFPTRIQEGDCPPGFEIRLPFLYYETIWNTHRLRDTPGTFILANGDVTGFGYHGDFMSGWNTSLLQQAINICRNRSGRLEDCPVLSQLDYAQTSQCSFKVPESLTTEDVRGPRRGLPGNVTVPGQYNLKLRMRDTAFVYGSMADTATQNTSQCLHVPGLKQSD